MEIILLVVLGGSVAVSLYGFVLRNALVRLKHRVSSVASNLGSRSGS
jgi:hypothetical protein